MMVLALDTTTRSGSSALVHDGTVLGERVSDPSVAPASRLPGELMLLLELAGLGPGAIDLFAVATGPGSFTGLRVGIATMQGLAFAAGKPLIGVSGFDALAEIANDDARGARVATWIDAWRGEVYAALYDRGNPVEPPTVAHPNELLPRLRNVATFFIGDGAGTYREAIRHVLGTAARVAEPASPPLAAVIGRLAAGRAEHGERPPPHAIRPVYVRRPDAELARRP